MAKPSSLPEWASDTNFSSGTKSGTATKTEPALAYKKQGWVPSLQWYGQYANWLLNLVYQWCAYLDNLHGETDFLNKTYAWVGSHSFTPATATAAGLTATGNTTGAGVVGTGGTGGPGGTFTAGTGSNENGVSGLGNLTGEGVYGKGGLTGAGGVFEGGNTSGAGIVATGIAGNSNGATCTGVGTGIAVRAIASSTGRAVHATATGNYAIEASSEQSAIYGACTLDSGSGKFGVLGEGRSAGVRGTATGSGNGDGVQGTGVGTGAGVSGTGGSSAGPGGVFTGGSSGAGGLGVQGTGVGAGPGVKGVGENAPGGQFSTTANVRGALYLVPVTSDPSTPIEGDIWYRSDTGKLRLRLSASTVDLN